MCSTNHKSCTCLTLVCPEFAGKKTVSVVPGAFSPTCRVSHLPGYIANAGTLQSEAVDKILFITLNDVWVMSA